MTEKWRELLCFENFGKGMNNDELIIAIEQTIKEKDKKIRDLEFNIKLIKGELMDLPKRHRHKGARVKHPISRPHRKTETMRYHIESIKCLYEKYGRK